MSESSEEPSEEVDADEAKESDDDYEKEGEEVRRESVELLYNVEGAEIEKAIQMLKSMSSEISFNSDAEIQSDIIDSTYTNSGISDEDAAGNSVDEVESLRRRVRDYRQEEVGTESRRGRFFARSKGLMLLLAFASTISAIATVIIAIFEAVRASDTPGTPSNDGLTDDQRKVIMSQVVRWRNLGDSTVWATVSKYCDDWNPSWQAQILLMDTIKRLATPLNPGWGWRGSDAAGYTRALVDAYSGFVPAPNQKRSRILYSTVADMSYDRLKDGHLVKLPRQVAADIVELAITDLLQRKTI